MDSCVIHCPSAEETGFLARNFSKTLYAVPCTITLSGPLGAGKTTFLQSWIGSIGVAERVTSPTFALEQRYETSLGLLLHLDLYRLTTPQALDLLSAGADADAIRCIEWPERAATAFERERPIIRLTFTERGDGRDVRFDFDDIDLPSRADVETWREEVRLPAHVARHCDAVADVAERLGRALLERRIVTRPLALRRAGELHDLLRFVDFRPGASPAMAAASQKDLETWARWKERFAGLRHEAACTALLRERGYHALGRIIEPHGLAIPSPKRGTIEQQILFYADKRVRENEVVSLDERFADFAERYGRGGTATPEQRAWYEEAKELESVLFPEGVPF